MKLNNLFESEQYIYANQPYLYKGYVVEKLMTSGLPYNPNIPSNVQGSISHSYWTIKRRKDTLDGNIQELPIELLKPIDVKELDSLINRENDKRIEQETEYKKAPALEFPDTDIDNLDF